MRRGFSRYAHEGGLAPMEIKTIAVIGAGTMGRGIAYAAALGGYRTVLEDVSAVVLDQGLAYIRQAFEDGVARGKVTPEQKDLALRQLVKSASVEDACREAELVIEAVPEDMELKIELFTILDKFAKPGAIFASNTSSLSVTEMAAVTFRPEVCVGMHFFNPVPKMKLLEVVRALETSEATLAACGEVGRRMGKEVVVVRESPGFITSRINAMIGNEAFYMLEAGIASAADIDKALKLGLNHPMGPFELVDLVGLDVRLSILEYLHKTLGDKYRPCPLLAQYVKAGRLGRKAGRGVYDYPAVEKKQD
jgi:3-hydroxybutyryl-CoA dehydrogenase